MGNITQGPVAAPHAVQMPGRTQGCDVFLSLTSMTAEKHPQCLCQHHTSPEVILLKPVSDRLLGSPSKAHHPSSKKEINPDVGILRNTQRG